MRDGGYNFAPEVLSGEEPVNSLGTVDLVGIDYIAEAIRRNPPSNQIQSFADALAEYRANLSPQPAIEGQPAIEYQAPVPGYWDYDNADVTNEYTSILGINNNGLEYTDLSNNDNIIGESSTDTAIYKLHYNDSRIVIEKNNNVISTSETSLDPSSSGLVVGRNFSGLIGEVIFFDRRVTTTEDNSISDYLSKKWGTYE